MIYNFTTFLESINDNNAIEIKKLQKELKKTDDWCHTNTYGTLGFKDWDKNAEKAGAIRRRLFELTGDPYGITKKEKEKKKIKPKGLDAKYDSPFDVPKNVYKWISNNTSLLYTDASDAVRWSRIINTKNDERYPSGDITIYRAVDNHDYDEIREGDWVTTEEVYARQHNNKYFDGDGKIISMEVDGRDVLVSPTGDSEEAIYAPRKYSIDVKL